jgi:hypothetical protein
MNSMSLSITDEVSGTAGNGPSEELKLSLMKKGLFSILDDSKNSVK